MSTRVNVLLGWAGLLALAVTLPTWARTEPNITGQSLESGLPGLGKAFRDAQGQPVKLAAGPHVRERRLYLFQEDRPLSSVQLALSRLVPHPPGRATWKRDGSVLVFDEDADSWQARQRGGAAFANTDVGRRARAVDAARRNTQPRADDDELTARMRRYAGKFIAVWDGLPEWAKQRTLRGQPVEVPLLSLAPAAQPVARGLVATFMGGPAGHPESLFVGRRDWQKAVVRITPYRNGGDHPGMLGVVGDPNGGGRSMPDFLNLPEYSHDARHHFGWDGLNQNGAARPYHPVGAALAKRFPELDRPVQLAPDGGVATLTVRQCLRELTEQAATPLVGDYDPCFRDPFERAGQVPRLLNVAKASKEPLWQAMDRVCQAFDLTWDYRAGWLELRSPRQAAVDAGLLDFAPQVTLGPRPAGSPAAAPGSPATPPPASPLPAPRPPALRRP